MNWPLGNAVLLAMAISLASTFVVRGAARRLAWLDQPNHRKVHTDPIPLLGGIAMYVAFVAAVLVTNSRTVLHDGLAVLIGATVLLVVGVIDDRRGIAPLPKLLAQIAAALVLVVGGIGVNLFPFAWMNAATTVLWVVGICNAMNLLDNMDGLSAGVAAIACLFFTVLAVIHGQIWVSMIAAVLLGAIVGFLWFNWNPATIFMGDAGSLLLGFLLAVLGLMLRFPGGEPRRTWLIPILILAVPIFDTTLVTVSRLRRRIPISSGGRDHLSHRLVGLGLTVRQSVAAIYLAGFICGSGAVFLALYPRYPVFLGAIITVVMTGAVAAHLLERLDLSNTGQLPRAEPVWAALTLRSRGLRSNQRYG